MRDALSMMDQAIASAPLENGRAVLQTDQIRELMGSVPNAVFERLMEAVSAQQSARLMEDLDKLIGSGNSPAALARQLVRYLRNCLMAKLGGENTGLLEIAFDERARAARTALLFTEEELTRNLQIALRTFDELNYRQEQRFHLELGLLKLIQAQRLLPMEEILSGLATQSSTKRSNPAPNSPSGPSRPVAPAPPARPAPPAPPFISPFASSIASNQRATEVPLSSPVRELPKAENPTSVVGQGFSPATNSAPSIGALAPEVRSTSPSSKSQLSPVSEPTAVGLLELPESSEEAQEVEAIQESAPEIVSSLSTSADTNGDVICSAVVEALVAGGHSTAANILGDGKWNVEGTSVRIEVNAKATMIRLTFNAAAEKIIRQGLSQAGAPSRFMIVPGEGLTSSGSSNKVRAPLGSIESEARSNPLVVQAQAVFNAEIVTVVDLREK